MVYEQKKGKSCIRSGEAKATQHTSKHGIFRRQSMSILKQAFKTPSRSVTTSRKLEVRSNSYVHRSLLSSQQPVLVTNYRLTRRKRSILRVKQSTPIVGHQLRHQDATEDKDPHDDEVVVTSKRARIDWSYTIVHLIQRTL